MKIKRFFKNKFIIFISIYLIFFSLNFTLITLSKYMGNINIYRDDAIAKWEVSLDTSSSDDTLEIIAGNTAQSYTLKVSSTSEVAARYSIVISNLPSNIEIKLDDGAYQTPVNNNVVFNNAGMFDANDSVSEHIHTLTFNVPLESDALGIREIDLKVEFSQLEPQ